MNPHKTGVNLVADIHHIPLRNKVISATLCKSVLEHVESPLKAILEMKRITKGRIIIIVPNVININRILRSLISPLHKVNPDTWHFQGWDSKLMKHLAIRAGLEFHSVEWGFEKTVRWGFICKPLFASHMITTLKDEDEFCDRCGSKKKRFTCEPDFSYCPNCDIEGNEKECLKS